VFQTKKQIEELKDKITPDAKEKLESEIKKVEDAIATNNSDTIKAATEALNKVWNEIASTLYSQANAGQQQPGAGFNPQDFANMGGQPGAEPKESKKDEKEVQDASYEEVDDKDKK